MKAKAEHVIILLAIAAFIFSACDKKDHFNTGAGLSSGAFVSDTFSILMQTQSRDSVSSEDLEYQLIGNFVDPHFGRTTAIAYALLKMTDEGVPAFNSSSTLESLVLSLSYADDLHAIGDLAQTQTWHIYQLADQLPADADHYSNTSFGLGELLGTYTGSLQPGQSGSLDITLNNAQAFAKRLFKADTNIYVSNTNFYPFIKGIAIVPDSTIPAPGAILPFDLATGSSLKLQYDSGKIFSMDMGVPAFTVNAYRHDFSSATELNDQLWSPSYNYDKVYLQAMGGTKVHVALPNIEDILDLEGDMAISKAEFIFPVMKLSNDPYAGEVPSIVLMRPVNEEGKQTISFDEALGYVDGKYNDADNSYHFILTKEIQFILNQFKASANYSNRGFYLLIPPERPVAPSRAVLSTQRSVNVQQPKLVLSYINVEEE